MKELNSVIVSGKEVLPIIEGGKGIGASNGFSAGAMAAAGGVGTFSGANALTYDENGIPYPAEYKTATRRERHEELVEQGVRGGIQQAQIARDICGGKSPVHINVLWEQGGAERILRGVLEGAKGLISGITCGAGMPYRLGEIATEYNVYYYPIVSSARAFRALWKRGYNKRSELLGGVVYEDPWLAGGHNGLSNSENPLEPQRPYERIVALRAYMDEVGLQHVPIVMAGGVWHLEDFEDWLDNPEIGLITFQFGTRTLLTKESPIPEEWKQKLFDVKEGEVLLHKFSPTGFYSSAVKNGLLNMLIGRSERQVPYSAKPEGDKVVEFPFGRRGRPIYLTAEDKAKTEQYIAAGYDVPMKTPDETIVFVDEEESQKILKSQADCMGCLSHCSFSNWKDYDDFTTGKRADPRSFCIQERLQGAIRGEDLEKQLVFAGHNAYKFGQDPFYKDRFIPTVQQLVDRIMTGK